MTKQVPVLLLTGYLGSGKTTLLNRILTNRRGIKFAVIVNDIGEVNIDESLIQKNGIVGKKGNNEGDLVGLQNGCICCTLRTDLIEQLSQLCDSGRFDYIVIEASGICEPEPIAQTICSFPRLPEKYRKKAIPVVDSIVTVVDALRLRSEFACGTALTASDIGDEDIENLIIQQIEFCNIILLNKVSEVQECEAGRIRAIIRAIQPKARIIDCDYCDIDLDKILNTGMFNFGKVATSAAWIRGIEEAPTAEMEAVSKGSHSHEHEGHEHHHHDEEHAHGHEEPDHHHDQEHGHHHHHHHDHDEGEAEEYGIGTFVYYRRPAFDMNKFDYFVTRQWPGNIIRTKGVLYFSHNTDMSYLFEQAGVQKKLSEAGYWYATAPEEDLIRLMQAEPDMMRDWDEKYGDRMIKLVFIGRHLDKKAISDALDRCLEN